MATSGSKSVKVTDWDTLKFSWSQKSQSVANNTTTISWTLQLIATSYGYISSSASKAWTVTVNGTKYSGTTTVGINNNSTKTLASGTTTIAHNSDGSKSFNYSFSQEFDITFNSWIGTVSGSGSGTLNTIPRKSSLTVSNGTLGTALTLTISAKASTFKHRIEYNCGSYAGYAAGSASAYASSLTPSWTPPLTFANTNTTGTSVSVKLTLYTYTSDGTLIGYEQKTITCAIPASVKPSCSLTLEDTTGIDDIYGSPVQGLSKIKVKVSTTLAYSSPIASYAVSIDGTKYTTAENTTGALKTAGDSPVTVTVKDKRGRSGTASYTMKVQAYTPAAVSKLTVQRCDADGTLNDRGNYLKAVFSAAVTALSSKNTAAYRLRYKKTSATSYSTVNFTALNNVYTVTDHSVFFAADLNSSYDVEVTATDRHGSSTRSTQAPTAFTLINWGADGTSMAIGKAAERENAVEVALNMHFVDGAQFWGTHGIYDTRDDNETPQWYMENHGAGEIWEFKRLTTVGFTSPSSAYGPVQTIIPWRDTSGGLPRQVAYEGRMRWTRIANSTTTWGAWLSDALIAYPVGSIYIAYNHTDPSTLFGGTWERLTGGFLWASQSGDIIGQTGGEKTHTLTVNELPKHRHAVTVGNTATGTIDIGDNIKYNGLDTSYKGTLYTEYEGGGAAHNNMPPYIQVSIWRRTA